MPRKKQKNSDTTKSETSEATTATAVAEPSQETAAAPRTRPAYIDGPPVLPTGEPVVEEEQQKNWANPYKAIITTSTFEMGENRRYKQRVFTFKEKPADEVLATLKENGFTYRPSEHAWTIPANPDTRRLSDELAEQFAGSSRGMSR
jgi:hypothetical protein